jgi:hypothetical protein
MLVVRGIQIVSLVVREVRMVGDRWSRNSPPLLELEELVGSHAPVNDLYSDPDKSLHFGKCKAIPVPTCHN